MHCTGGALKCVHSSEADLSQYRGWPVLEAGSREYTLSKYEGELYEDF